jgi:2-polyprenyl-3-methyl-5-hydroxy-6-metoxy-1,4-benzoquinol methylase
MTSQMTEYYRNSDDYAEMLANQDVHSYRPYVDIVSRFLQPNAKMLDVGCGIGTSTLLLAKAGFQVLGTDVSHRFIPAPEGTFKVVDFQDAIEISDGVYDAVGTMNVIEHTDDPKKFLAEILRVVRPGGYIFILAPNLTSPLVGIRIIFDLLKKRIPYLGIDQVIVAAALVFVNIWRSLRSELGYSAFEKREAILDTGIVGHDADAVYWTNAREMRRFLEQQNCEICLFQKQGNSSLSKFIAYVLPGFAGQVCIVARKR